MMWDSGMWSLFSILIMCVCMAGCIICGLLAERKGYNIYIWAAAGGNLVSFVVLAFLPYVNKESQEGNKQDEKTGNLVGAALAAVSLVGFASLIVGLLST